MTRETSLVLSYLLTSIFCFNVQAHEQELNLTETDSVLVVKGDANSIDGPHGGPGGGGAVFLEFQEQTLAGSYGSVKIFQDGTYDYVSNAAHDVLAEGAKYSEVFAFTTVDNIEWKLTVNITGTNDAPAISKLHYVLNATLNSNLDRASGILRIADVEADQSYFVEQVATENTYGLFSLKPNGAWEYTSKASHETLLVGKSISDAFTITAADGTQAGVSITIRGSKNPDATVVDGKSFYVVPDSESLTLRREVFKDGPNFTESDGWNHHRATVETLFKLEAGKRYSFRAQGISLSDPIIELAGPIAENTTYSVASQPEYGTVTVNQHTGSWLYAINKGETPSRDYSGFELGLTTDEAVAVPASSTLTSKKRTKVGTAASPSEYELKLVGKTITFKGSADGTLTGNGLWGTGFDADMSFELKFDVAPGQSAFAEYDSSYPRLYLHVEEDGTSTIDQIVSAIGALDDFFFEVKATTLLNSGSVGLRDKTVAGGNVNNWIARNDSGDYMGKDAEIIITAKTTGYYLLRCFGGGQSGNYDIGDLDLIVTKVAADDFGGDRSLLVDVEANGDLVKPVSIRQEWEDKTIADGQIDASAPAALAINTSFKGNLTNGDVDYVKVNLEIEKWYTFEVGGDLSDPKIELVNAEGGWVANGSEDGGVGLNGKVGFALSPGGSNVAGDYYLVIQSGAPEYWGRDSGDVSGEYVVKAVSGVRGQFGHWLENKDSNILKGTVPENDVPVGISTTVAPAIGTLFSGSIEIDSDRDWYKYSLVKDKIYRWDLESISLVKGSIVLRDATGEKRLVHDKLTVGGDGALETEGSIVYRAEYTGDVFVEVYSDADLDPENANTATGTFNLSSTELSDDYGGYIISQGHPSYIPISYDFNEAGYLQAGSRVYSDFYSGIEKYPKDINGNQINLSGNPRGDFDFFGVDLFSSNTYSFATYETEAAVSVGNNGGNYSAITLFDSLGNKVEGGDYIDGFSFTPLSDGYYYLRANSYNGPGGYMITSTFYGDDYSSNANTRGRVFLGESVLGELETTGDDDWIRADLQAGKRYKFEPDQSISNRKFDLYGPGELNDVDVQRALGWGGAIEDGFSKPDIGQDVTTARAIANALGDVNGGVKAHISFGDKDWYELTFEEGAVYQINLVGMPVYQKPALPDPMLTLYDPNGQFITLGNNNAGVNAAHSGIPGKDSELVYTATETGTFYVEVKAEKNRPIGDIKANGAAISGATTITVDKISRVMSPGDVLVFSSDAKFIIGVEATVNSTTLTGLLEGAIADNETAYLCDVVISESASDGATSLVLSNPTKKKFEIGDVIEFPNNSTFTVDAETDNGANTLTGVLSGSVGANDTGYYVGVGGYGVISTKLPVAKIATQYEDIIDWTPQYSAPYYLNFGSWFGEVGEYLIAMTSLPDASADDVVGSSRDSAVAFALGETVTTKIDYGGDLDWFQFEMLAGESYAIEVQGAGAGTSSHLSVRDRFGKAVDDWDYGDYWGSNEELGIDTQNSKIFYYSTPLYHLDPDTVPRTYYVQIGANIAGDVTFKVTHLFDDQKESPLTTGVLNVGDTASGTWENGVENGANIELIHGTGGGDGDWFKTQLIAGNTYKIDVFTDPANRPSMYIFAEDGTLLQPEDAVETIKDGHAQLTYTANRTGDFFIDPINTKSWGGNNIYDLSLVHIADDVASSIKTSATLAVGGETNGNLERVSDRDWFKVNLKRGHVYKFDLSGASLKDPTLRIRDSHGNQLLYNDQINGWWDPSITYTATEDGVYYVDTAGIDSGQFLIKCTNTYSPPSGSNFFIGKSVELKTNHQSDFLGSAVVHTIGNIAQGEITLPNDRRWYKVQLKKSRSYEFHLFGDSMQSPSLYLRDSKGAAVFPPPKLDKERSSGEKMVLQFTAPDDGEYILDAGGFWSNASGVATVGVATGTFSLQTFDLGLNTYRAVTWDTDFAAAAVNEDLSALGVGNSVSDSIVNAANRDLYKISLVEGALYTFRIEGQLVNGEVDLGVQPRLFLHSKEGTLVATETNNSLEYKATETGDFYIGVGATTGQPSGLNFRSNSPVPYSYNLKLIQSRAPKTEPTANWYAALKDTGVKSLVDAGISDNSLSRIEVLDILENIKDGGVVDADELNDLRVLVANHKEVVLSNYVATVLDNIANGDPANQYYTGRDGLNGRTSRAELGNLYPGSSTDRLSKLISKWFLGTDSPATSTQYARLDLPLYFDGAGTEDPRQGSVGDCYLIAAMSAIADTSVGSIDGTVPSVNPGDMIVDNGDDTYGVRFYDNDGAERWVTVDKFVPGHREDKLLFAGTNSGESWAMLVEKAYVQLNESDNISQDGTNRYGIGNNFGIAGGDSGQALSHLTGQKASYGFIDSDPGNEWTADKLRALLDQDLPLIFSTGAPCALASSYGVKRRHAYSYESYDPQTQKFYLRNSWGFEHAYVTFEGLQIMGSNIAYLDGTKTKMERIDANSTFSAAFGAYGDEEESEAGLTAVESFGAVTLYKDADNRLYAGSVAQGIKPVRINGQLATLSLNERTAIAAESIGGINQILWRDNYSQALIKMNFDSSWQFLPTENVLMAEGTDKFNAAQLAFGEGGNADITAPVITVTSGTDTVGQGTTWTDAGATADGGETVTPSGAVNTNTAGTYTITYTATDAAGNVGTATRTVTIVAIPLVTDVVGTNNQNSEITVSWTTGAGGPVSSFRVEYKEIYPSEGSWILVTESATGSSHLVTGLTNFSKAYKFRVSAIVDSLLGGATESINSYTPRDLKLPQTWSDINSYLMANGLAISADNQGSGKTHGNYRIDMDSYDELANNPWPWYRLPGTFNASMSSSSVAPGSVDDPMILVTNDSGNVIYKIRPRGDSSNREVYGPGYTNNGTTSITYFLHATPPPMPNPPEGNPGAGGGAWNSGPTSGGGRRIIDDARLNLGYGWNWITSFPANDSASYSFTSSSLYESIINPSSDTSAPIITIISGTDTVERGSDWTDAGATADTGETVIASGAVDTNTVGTYTITYTATDAAGNVATPVTRTVIVTVVNQPLVYTTNDGKVTIANFDKTVVGELIIPSVIEGNPVTSIGAGAFEGCTGLTSITIPDSVTSIGAGAFEGCTGLTSITIPDSVISIGTAAFNGCTSLTGITVGNSVTSIGTAAFYGCTGLTSITIPDSVTTIGESAFNGCTGLTSITIPDSVISIGTAAFGGCTGLTSITIGDSVTSIGEDVFAGLTNLTSITIGDSVTSIGENVFSGLTNLTSITIGDSVTSIGEGAFAGLTNLTSITIGDSVTSIGEGAFSGLTNLTSITIGDSVTSIGTAAFYGCTSLTGITIGNSVTSIGTAAFYGCTGLTSITIPDSVTTIGESAFNGCTGLTSITIGDSVTSIGEVAFGGCTGLTSITIPDSVISIGTAAFGGCTSLTEIIFQGAAPTVGTDVFTGVAAGASALVVNESLSSFGENGDNWNGLALVTNFPPVITVTSGTDTVYASTAIAADSTNSALYGKSLHVNGLEIVQGAAISGQAAVPDLFTEKVAQVVKLMITGSGADIDNVAQRNMIRTLRGETGTWHETRPTAQRILRGAGADYSVNPLVDSNYSSYSGLQAFQDTHSTKDMIWYLSSDAASGSGDADITEVVEHLMHTIHSYGVRGGVSGSVDGLSWIPGMDPDWKTRELFLAFKQAVDNGVFSLTDYGDGNYNTASTFELAVIEYLYLLNFNMWEYSTLWDGGSLAPEWNDNSRTPSGIEANNPLGYALYNKYIKPVLAKPSLSTLRSIFQDGDVGDPAIAGSSGYTPGDSSVTDTVERGSSWVDAGATAGGGETVTASGTVDTNTVGTYTITYTATDGAGNTGTATRIVTVVADTTPPTIVLLGDASVTVEGGTTYIDAGATASDATDGDLTSSISTVSNVNKGAVGSYTVVYNVSDAAGNTATQVTRTVTVVDTTPPVITFDGPVYVLEDVTPSLNLNSYGSAYASDSMDGDLTISITEVNKIDPYSAGEYTRTWNVSDAAGNAATPFIQYWLFQDITPAVITVTSGDHSVAPFYENNEWVYRDQVEQGSTWTDPGATFVDWRVGDLTEEIVVTGAVDTNTVGTYTITYTATYTAGDHYSQKDSAYTATRMVSVVDTTAPVITVTSGTDTVEQGSNWTDAGATVDTGETVTASGAVDTGVIGTYIVTYNVSDAAGNVATPATRTVTVVVDTTAPVITVTSGADTVEQGSTWTDAGATADGGETVTPSGVVNTSAAGTYTVTYTATDGAGNVGTATRTVTVVDTTAPVITLSGSAIATVEAGFPYNDAGATADGQEVVTSTGTVDANTVGSYTITYSATDAAGNTATPVKRTVIVEDTISPVITVTTGNDTVERGSSWTNAGATTTEGSISFTGTVNTDVVGTYTITYSATDSSNNTATATRTVTVVSSEGGDNFGDVVVYPNNSARLTGQVKIEGEFAESGDVVAIYVGSELRGKQEVIIVGGVAWVNALVNAAGGNETISFKVYDASTGVTHEKSKTSAVITTGGDVGSFASPLMIEMKDFETQTLSLKEGWNLVSFYVEGDDMSPATVLGPIQNKLLQIKNLTQTYDPTLPANFAFLNNLSSLSGKDGYWLKVSEDVSLDVEGAVPSGASITVKSGWNLVGYPRLIGENVVNELTSLGNTVVQMKNLTQTYDSSIPAELAQLNTLSTMVPGSGYWLNVTQDGTWKLGDGGPNFGLFTTRSNHSPEQKVGPVWGEPVISPNLGATVLAKVSIQGKPVAMGSVVGVFVGNELRGLQDVVLNEGMSYVTLNVNLNEAEEVSYRVWNSDDNNEYLVSGTMQLELGEMYGNPELVELNAVEVVNKPLQVFNVTSEPFGFSFNTMAGRNYTVEATGDLRTWEAVELFQGSGGEIRFTAKPTSSGRRQFFRVSVK